MIFYLRSCQQLWELLIIIVYSTSTRRDMGINRSKKSWSVRVEYFLVPIITDLYLAPSHLLQFVRCKCKTKNRRSSTSLCSFRKHGLKCVSSCGTCRGVSCEHSDIRDLILISHYYMGSKRPERTISLYDFGTIAPSTLILSINLTGGQFPLGQLSGHRLY